MLEAVKAARQFFLEARGAGCGQRIARGKALAAELEERELREFKGTRVIPLAALIVDGQLLASAYAVVRITDEFVPETGRGFGFAASFGQQSEFARSLGAEQGREPRFEGFGADRMGAVPFAATIQEARETEKVEGLRFIKRGIAFVKQGIDFAIESGEAAQVHLIVFKHGGQRKRRAATKVVEIKLRYQGGDDLVFAMPAKAGRIQDVAFQYDEANRTEAKPPERAGRMKQVEMSRELGNLDRAGHGEATLEERPIECFAIEGNQDGTLRDARRELLEQRIFLGKIAKEKLFDLETAGVPPRETDEESVGAGAAGEAGGFCVEEEPLVRVFKRNAGAARESFIASAGE
jgi:hypothetical protein